MEGQGELSAVYWTINFVFFEFHLFSFVGANISAAPFFLAISKNAAAPPINSGNTDVIMVT